MWKPLPRKPPKHKPRKAVKEERIEAAGRISKTFGANGELVISLYDTFPYENPVGESVYVVIDGLRTPLFFKSFRRRGERKAVVVFDDLETEYRAAELVGQEFFAVAEPEADEADDEIYLEDLVGYNVRIQGHKGIGKITGYIDHDLNPLFELAWNGADILVPAADDFIASLDEKQKTLRFDLPEGLLEL